MAVYSLKTVQRLPITLERAWEFFSDPANLQTITPADMAFKMISGYDMGRMYAGQLIEYRVSPLFGIPVYWMTEIMHVVDKRYFVDEQRFGPYALWHHQHHFRNIEGGVEMTDIVHYKIPFWIFGDIANTLFVRKKLDDIFEFRKKKVEELFGLFQ